MDSDLRLSTWTHPRTGEVRVYVNGHGLGFDVKIWFTQGPEVDPDFPMAHHRLESPVSLQRVEEIEAQVAEAHGRSWKRLLEAAQKGQS